MDFAVLAVVWTGMGSLEPWLSSLTDLLPPSMSPLGSMWLSVVGNKASLFVGGCTSVSDEEILYLVGNLASSGLQDKSG
jgi:hypothetical protein